MNQHFCSGFEKTAVLGAAIRLGGSILRPALGIARNAAKKAFSTPGKALTAGFVGMEAKGVLDTTKSQVGRHVSRSTNMGNLNKRF